MNGIFTYLEGISMLCPLGSQKALKARDQEQVRSASRPVLLSGNAGLGQKLDRRLAFLHCQDPVGLLEHMTPRILKGLGMPHQLLRIGRQSGPVAWFFLWNDYICDENLTSCVPQ